MFLMPAGIPYLVRALMQVSVAAPPSQPGEASTVPDPSRLAALMQVSVAAPPSQPGEASTVPDPSRLAIPTRRLRKKTTLIPVPQKKRRRTENLKGNPKGTGKKQMATIAEKEKIMSTYLSAVKEGVKKPHKLVSKMKGYFPGCVYESKWGKVRKIQKWDVFVATAPSICSKCKELPNAFRRILKLGKLKSFPSTTSVSDSAEQVHLPVPLQAAVEDLVTERLDLGEEVSMSYVKNVLDQGIAVWNQVVALLCFQYLYRGKAFCRMPGSFPSISLFAMENHREKPLFTTAYCHQFQA